MNNQAPARQLRTNRGWLKTLLLSIVTLGIYPLVMYTHIGEEVNLVATPHDGKKTMNYCLLFFLIGPITGEIGTLVWYHRICNRIGNELKVRGISYKFGAGTFWLWNTLGLLIGVGPIIFLHKMLKAMNLINAHYNVNG